MVVEENHDFETSTQSSTSQSTRTRFTHLAFRTPIEWILWVTVRESSICQLFEIASHFRNFEKLTLFPPNLPISHPALHPLQLVTLPSAVSLDPNPVEPPFEIAADFVGSQKGKGTFSIESKRVTGRRADERGVFVVLQSRQSWV